MGTILVYITAENKDQARTIGTAIVEERLAACVNIIDGMNSIYWWEGTMHESSETVLIAKTRDTLLDKLTSRVKELHPYSCPCIVALPIIGGNESFLQWILDETTPTPADRH
jgi:periplasmic divalent cation tolerance protein